MKNDRSVSLLFNDECIVFRLTGKNVIIDVETIIQIVELKLKNDLHKVQTELALRIDDRSTIVDRVEKQLKSRLKRIFSRMKTNDGWNHFCKRNSTIKKKNSTVKEMMSLMSAFKTDEIDSESEETTFDQDKSEE